MRSCSVPRAAILVLFTLAVAFPAKPATLGSSLQNAARKAAQKGDYKEAEKSLRGAVALVTMPRHAQMTELTEEEVHVVSAWRSLGDVYRDTGYFRRAEECYIEATERAPGEDLGYLPWILSSRGSLYRLLGRYAQAERMLRRAVEIPNSTRVGPNVLAANYAALASGFSEETGMQSLGAL